tara:strand:- start:51421 stop:52701 length:1281 start_codon:yes stop_codon:yes gene_type:complete
MKAVFAVAGLWSFLILSVGFGHAQEVLTREEALNRAVDAAFILDAQKQQIIVRGAEIKQASLKPNPFITADIEDFTGSGPYSGLGQSQISLRYNQLYERGDKRRYRRSIATQDREIARVEWRLARLNIMRQAEQAYIKILTAQLKLDSFNDQVKIFEQTLNTLEMHQSRGQTSSLTVQNARLQLLSARRQVSQFQLDLEVSKQELASLWENADVTFSIDARELNQLPEVLSLPEINTAENPDILFWKQQIKRSSESMSLEKAKSVQDITFNMGVRYLQGTQDVALVAGVSMPFALYDTNVNNVRKAGAAVNKSQIELMAAERLLKRQLLLQVQKRAAAFTQVRIINAELIPEAKQTEAIALQRLEQGIANYLDVYAAQSVVANFSAQLITELQQFHLAQSEINRLTAHYDDAKAVTATIELEIQEE